MRTKIIISLLLLILAVICALQNSGVVPLKFLFWDAMLPVALLIVITLAVGVILGLILTLSARKHEKKAEIKPEDQM